MTRPPYIQFFPEIFRDRVEHQNDMIQQVRADKVEEKRLDRHLVSISYGFVSIGIGEFILHSDVIKAKQNFYLSSRIREVLVRKYDDKSLPVDPSFAVSSNYNHVFSALISDCNELVDAWAKVLGGRPEIEKDHYHPFPHHFAYALKYVLLNDYEKAREHVESLKEVLSTEQDEDEIEVVGDLQLNKGYMTVLDGILRSDRDAVQEGLIEQIAGHKLDPEYEGTPAELFSIPVLALAKLAIRKGFDVSVDDPIAPKVMLEKHEMEYPIIDFI